MKYIISESKLNKSIERYIDNMYRDLIFVETDICSTNIYLGTDLPFKYKQRCFYTQALSHIERFDVGNINAWKKARKNVEESPTLIVLNSTNNKLLFGLFGDLWIPVFKQWFEKKYKLGINTITLPNNR
jgi:hypothetical protein